MSGGEIQRVKLAQHLDEEIKNSIFIFDEPTTGLHESDIPILMECFDDLIDQNNTVILIEHNLSIMCEADWIIDVGPGLGWMAKRSNLVEHLKTLLIVQKH